MRKSILFILEGKRPDRRFIEKYLEAYGLDGQYEPFVVGTNIYQLYSKMKKEHFELNITHALKEMPVTLDDKDLLNRQYTYTYLIYDCDAQDVYYENERMQEVDVKTNILSNINKLAEMSEHFCDETDPTIGKLYINYPMIESYRDCNEFFDEDYKSKFVNIRDLNNYKNMVGKTRIGNIDINRYTKENFNSLIRMNVYKLNLMKSNRWSVLEYEEYLTASKQTIILELERKRVNDSDTIGVLNTSLFWILDYYGQRERFYDEVLKVY